MLNVVNFLLGFLLEFIEDRFFIVFLRLERIEVFLLGFKDVKKFLEEIEDNIYFDGDNKCDFCYNVMEKVGFEIIVL